MWRSLAVGLADLRLERREAKTERPMLLRQCVDCDPDLPARAGHGSQVTTKSRGKPGVDLLWLLHDRSAFEFLLALLGLRELLVDPLPERSEDEPQDGADRPENPADQEDRQSHSPSDGSERSRNEEHAGDDQLPVLVVAVAVETADEASDDEDDRREGGPDEPEGTELPVVAAAPVAADLVGVPLARQRLLQDQRRVVARAPVRHVLPGVGDLVLEGVQKRSEGQAASREQETQQRAEEADGRAEHDPRHDRERLERVGQDPPATERALVERRVREPEVDPPRLPARRLGSEEVLVDRETDRLAVDGHRLREHDLAALTVEDVVLEVVVAIPLQVGRALAVFGPDDDREQGVVAGPVELDEREHLADREHHPIHLQIPGLRLFSGVRADHDQHVRLGHAVQRQTFDNVRADAPADRHRRRRSVGAFAEREDHPLVSSARRAHFPSSRTEF